MVSLLKECCRWKQDLSYHSDYHISPLGDSLYLWVSSFHKYYSKSSSNVLYSLIGAISRRLGFVRAYFGMLIVHLLFSMGTGVFAIYRNFKDAPKYISDCASGSEDPSVLRVCNDGAAMVKGVMIAVFILAWFLETCTSSILSWRSHTNGSGMLGAVVIVAKYSKQLAEEEMSKNAVKDTESW